MYSVSSNFLRLAVISAGVNALQRTAGAGQRRRPSDRIEASQKIVSEVAAPGQSREFIAITQTHIYYTTLFCSLAVLDLRVDQTMDVLSPCISVLCHSDRLFHGESCPDLDVVHPGRAWSSSPACTWHSLRYLSFSRQLPCFLMV